MHTFNTNYKFLFTCLFFISASLITKSQSIDYVPNELIIKWKTNRNEQSRSKHSNVLALKGRKLKKIRGTNIEVWKIPFAEGKDIAALIEQYKSHPDIEFIEPNYIYKSFEVVPNDPLFNEQWGLKNTRQTGSTITADISVTDAWEIQKQSASVKVAIINSGIDWKHRLGSCGNKIFSYPQKP